MSYSTARRDIEKRLQNNWATTEVAYDNVDFDEPKQSDSWIRLRVFEDSSNRINIGKKGVHRQAGTIALEIYIPRNTGTKLIQDHADALAGLFRDAQFNGITCREASLSINGDFNGWYQGTLTIPFHWDGIYP